MSVISILGDGAWGTALGLILAKKGLDVYIWSPFEDQALAFMAKRENTTFLPGISLPKNITFGTDLETAFNKAEYLVASTPTPFLREVLNKGKRYYDSAIPVISVGKGIETDTLKTRTQIIREILQSNATGVLSGPSHAEEVARGLPAAVVAAAEDVALARKIQDLFSNGRFRVYTSDDEIGVELGGALKNVMAIAAGICVGLELGDNTLSALMSRGIMEMARIGTAMGAKKETFFGLSGIGDLITTCVSPFGRNRSVGIQIGKGKTLDEILKDMQAVAEGILTTKSVRTLCMQEGIDAPITEQIYLTLYENKTPMDVLNDLMLRDLKGEW